VVAPQEDCGCAAEKDEIKTGWMMKPSFSPFFVFGYDSPCHILEICEAACAP
jgi:hypothetical protein